MKTTEEAADMVLRAAGSSLANYTMPSVREEILAAVRAVQKDAAPQWLPIESAPKNKVLLYFPAIKDGSHSSNNLPEMQQIGIASHYPNRRPTHWQPLPTPPEAK